MYFRKQITESSIVVLRYGSQSRNSSVSCVEPFGSAEHSLRTAVLHTLSIKNHTHNIIFVKWTIIMKTRKIIDTMSASALNVK